MLRKLIKPGVALAIAALVAWFALPNAFAISNDQTRNFPARLFPSQQTHYLRFTVNWNDPVISTGQQFATLQQNAYVQRITCQVTTAFNAGTTNTLQVGTTKTGGPGDLIGLTGSNHTVTIGSTGFTDVTSALGLGIGVTSDADHPLYAKYAQTGTAATAGAVTCVVEYMPPNDQ